ncbi:anti-repressor SinI family protein [Peribacillus sp. NPDC097295]
MITAEMDQEWMTLILEAKSLGLTKEEIRDYFAQESLKENHEK